MDKLWKKHIMFHSLFHISDLKELHVECVSHSIPSFIIPRYKYFPSRIRNICHLCQICLGKLWITEKKYFHITYHFKVDDLRSFKLIISIVMRVAFNCHPVKTWISWGHIWHIWYCRMKLMARINLRFPHRFKVQAWFSLKSYILHIVQDFQACLAETWK